MDSNQKGLIEAIKQLRLKQPTISSNEIWDYLVMNKRWPSPLDEITVECCLVEHFDYPWEETILMRRDILNNPELLDPSCDCVRPRQMVTEDDIKYYENCPEKVDPRETISGPLLKMMLNTPSTIKSFLPQSTPTSLSAMSFSDMTVAQRAYALFYAEWDAWMGPPSGQIHAKVEHRDGMEAVCFEDVSHCEHRMTYWTPEFKYSFEQHAQRALRSPCSNWRSNFKWLKFALSRTQDPDTIMMVNSVLVGRHGLKCRHMSNMFTEWHNWHSEWFYECRVLHTKTGAIAYVTPKKGDPEVEWAKNHENDWLDHYPPLVVDIGSKSPSLDSQNELRVKQRKESEAMALQRRIARAKDVCS
ncbi:301f9893-46ba-4a44-a99a-5577d6ca8258 [Sclerotinia trifoliorum]|uniref:301f9893-46ba-4a44-a99a-5577d6ca8258 n=1 Tax=Sclerotinia trifoliorum TaxID=28548 RepID=A0A8H2W432_9HELO|nr:301f9893-46ba-4a44-a99a-5577d6ca8258 [Sclerotinia trifoliorum]